MAAQRSLVTPQEHIFHSSSANNLIFRIKNGYPYPLIAIAQLQVSRTPLLIRTTIKANASVLIATIEFGNKWWSKAKRDQGVPNFARIRPNLDCVGRNIEDERIESLMQINNVY